MDNEEVEHERQYCWAKMNATDADGFDDDGDGYDDDGDGYDDDGDGDNNDGGTTSCDPRGEFSQPTQIEYHHIIFLFIYPVSQQNG